MADSEPAVTLNEAEINALEGMAQQAGTSVDVMVRAVLKKALRMLDAAALANDPVHGSPASNVHPLRPRSVPD